MAKRRHIQHVARQQPGHRIPLLGFERVALSHNLRNHFRSHSGNCSQHGFRRRGDVDTAVNHGFRISRHMIEQC